MRSACYEFLLLLFISFVAPSSAYSMSRDVRAILICGTYGVAAGTVTGLTTVPFTQTFRSTFLGSSVGLYLGLIAGVYYITHRTDPQNPLTLENISQTSWKPMQKEFNFISDSPPARLYFEVTVLSL